MHTFGRKKPFVCHINSCEKRFRNKTNLTDDQRRCHFNCGPNMCSYKDCNKNRAQNSYKLFAMNIKPYKCDANDCDKNYCRKVLTSNITLFKYRIYI